MAAALASSLAHTRYDGDDATMRPGLSDWGPVRILHWPTWPHEATIPVIAGVQTVDPVQTIHPARFGDELLVKIGDMLAPYGPLDILDPFAGTGRVHELRSLGHWTLGVEIEPAWASLHPGTVCGNSLHLADVLAGRRFDAIVTSPVYGNRMSDAHDNRDTCKACGGTGAVGAGVTGNGRCRTCLGSGISMRRSYTHDLRRMTGDPSAKLRPDNAGQMQWGKGYKDFHEKVWAQAPALLKGQKVFVLNCKDHVRNRERQRVVDWHVETLESLGFTVERREQVDTGGLRHGSNRERYPEEIVLLRLS